MPATETVSYTTYTYDELFEQAQEKARDHWSRGVSEDMEFISQGISDDITTHLETAGWVPYQGKNLDVCFDTGRGAYVSWTGCLTEAATLTMLRTLLHGKKFHIQWPLPTEANRDEPKETVTVMGTSAWRSLSTLVRQDPYALELGAETKGGMLVGDHISPWSKFNYGDNDSDLRRKAFAALAQAWMDYVVDLAGKFLTDARNEEIYRYSESVMLEEFESGEWRFLITGVPARLASRYDIERAIQEEQEAEDSDATSVQAPV